MRGSEEMGADPEDFPGTIIVAGSLFDTPAYQAMILERQDMDLFDKIGAPGEQLAKHAMLLSVMIVEGTFEGWKTILLHPSELKRIPGAVSDIVNDEEVRDIAGELADDVYNGTIGRIPVFSPVGP